MTFAWNTCIEYFYGVFVLKTRIEYFELNLVKNSLIENTCNEYF